MSSLHLEVVTPDKLVVCRPVEYVGAPGVEGEFGIMPGHIPFLSALAIGGLYYRTENKAKPYHIFISGGFAEVSDNKVTILAESAEEAENIDEVRASAAKERAEKRLLESSDRVNHRRARAALARATHRLDVLSKLRL